MSLCVCVYIFVCVRVYISVWKIVCEREAM